MPRKFDDEDYLIPGKALECIWREIYLPLIEDDGTPRMAIRGDRRRDMAQRLEGLLGHAYQVRGWEPKP